MSIIVDITLPLSELGLERTLTAVRDVYVEVERIVYSRELEPMPYLWVVGDGLDAFEAEIREDPTVSEATRRDVVDGSALYEVRWSLPVRERLRSIPNHGGVVLGAKGQDPAWRIQLRFASHSEVSAFYCEFQQTGMTFRPERVSRLSADEKRGLRLTAAQREALLRAYESGYFEVPRRITTSELADDLGISANAASQRLRRGFSSVLESTMIE